MTDESFKDLERELTELEPNPLSSQFYDQLEKRLARPAHDEAGTSGFAIAFGWGVGMASSAALAAAAILIVFMYWQARDEPADLAKANGVRREPGISGLGEGPSLLAYHHAMANSGDDLDKLLELHARKLLPPVPDPLTAGW